MWECTRAPRRAAQGRSARLCKVAMWGSAGVQCGAALGRSAGLRKGEAWDWTGAQCRAAPGRCAGLRKGALQVCEGAECGVARGRRVGLCRDTVWNCVGAPWRAAQGRTLIAPLHSSALRPYIAPHCAHVHSHTTPLLNPPLCPALAQPRTVPWRSLALRYLAFPRDAN